MRLSRREFAATLGTAAFAGCLGLGSDGNGSGETSVELLLNWRPSGLHVPYYAAAAEGFYDDEGVDVTNITVGQGSDFSARQVGLGNEDLGITSADQLLNINTRELSPRCIGVVMQRSPIVVFTARDQFGSELTDPSQLAGNTVGSGPGMVRLMTQSYLDFHDVRETVEYVDTGFDTVQQLLVGEVDAAGGVFGDVVDAHHQGATIDVLRVNEAIPSYGHVIATHESVMESNPEMLRGFLRGTAHGAAWAHDNPADAVDHLVDAVPELGEVRANQRDKWEELAQNYMLGEAVAENGWGWNLSEPWNRTHDVLEAGDNLDGDVDPDDVWTNEFLDTEYEYIGDYADQIGN